MAEPKMPDNSSLQPNSHKYHEESAKSERPKAEPVVTGKASRKKKGTGTQIKEALIGDVEEVRSYLLWDVLIPAVKDTLVDLIKSFAEGIFHSGGSAGRRNQYVQRNGQTSYVSYSSYGDNRPRYSRGYDRRIETRPLRGSYNPRYAQDFGGILYDSRQDAENVLDALAARTMEYGMASVADLYELSGIPSSYTDTDYGWLEVSDATVQRTRDGYNIVLPKPERLD